MRKCLVILLLLFVTVPVAAESERDDLSRRAFLPYLSLTRPTATPTPLPTATPAPLPTATPIPLPTATPLPKTTYFNYDAAFTYAGTNWSSDYSYPNLYRSGADEVNSGVNTTDYMELPFTGTGVTLFGSWRQNAGKQKVYLKAGSGSYVFQAEIDEYGVVEVFSTAIWGTHALPYGNYTVRVDVNPDNSTSAPSGEKLFHFDYAQLD